MMPCMVPVRKVLIAKLVPFSATRIWPHLGVESKQSETPTRRLASFSGTPGVEQRAYGHVSYSGTTPGL